MKGNMKPLTHLALLALTALSCGCAAKTEDQRLARLRTSLKCRTYRATSAKLTQLAVNEFNKAEGVKTDEGTVHGLLGIAWLLAGKPEFACVEADTRGAARPDEPDLLGMGLRTVALYQMKMPGLSAQEYARLNAARAAEGDRSVEDVSLEHKGLLVAWILVGLHLREDQLALQSATALGAVCQLDYLAPLVSLGIEARNGNLLVASQKLNELRTSPQFARHKQALLEEFGRLRAAQKADGEVPRDAYERLMVVLVKGVLADVFTGDKVQELMQRATDLTAGLDGNRASDASPPATNATAASTPVE